MNILLLFLGWWLNLQIKIKIVELASAIDDEKETSESESEVDSTTYQISDLEPVELETEPPRFLCNKCGKMYNKRNGRQKSTSVEKSHYFKTDTKPRNFNIKATIYFCNNSKKNTCRI